MKREKKDIATFQLGYAIYYVVVDFLILNHNILSGDVDITGFSITQGYLQERFLELVDPVI
jgi:hypothetical protein